MTNLCVEIILLIAFALPGKSQTHETEHTLRYSQCEPRPKATLQDAAWLQGAWEGSAFGRISQEIWSEPLGKTSCFDPSQPVKLLSAGPRTAPNWLSSERSRADQQISRGAGNGCGSPRMRRP